MSPVSGWNYADVWEAVANSRPESPALMHGELVVSWRTFDEHANGIAAVLLDSRLPRQAKVAQYLRNRPEFLESLYAVFKAGLVPVNTNFRYSDEELIYLWEDCEAAAVIFEPEFTDAVERVRHRLPNIRVWLRTGSDADCPAWAVPYAQAAVSRAGRVEAPWGRSGDDLYLLYTGGTTGKPKGVMWRQDDLFRMLEGAQHTELPPVVDPQAFVNRFSQANLICLPAAPLMHGTACWFIVPILARGGAVVTLTKPSLDPVELLDTVEARTVKGLCIAGEAFIRPILRELEGDSGRWDLSRLRVVFSSGAMLSHQSKSRLIRFAPQAMIVDGLGTSESGTMARAISTAEEVGSPATFKLSANTRVIDMEGADVVPGSGQSGRLAISGFLPLGYFRDPEKTAATFIELDGRRYVVAGDWAEVAEDGSITLLGRGSSCINTGGEKVYPEEVEEVLKAADGVRDAGVVGLPDERFGEAVTALVQLEPGVLVDERDLINHVKAHLAGYKAPKHVIIVEALPRGPNGKLDQKGLRQQAADAVGAGGWVTNDRR